MAKTQGTPKTLEKAIENGISDWDNNEYPDLDGPSVIRVHVRDFLGQKFAVSYLLAEDDATEKLLKNLWKNITGEET